MTDFFISYTAVDKDFAKWIASVLKNAGFTTKLQAWDFPPGSNFVIEMQNAATEADRTIAVLSPEYLKSSFGRSEWAAAFARDPEGLERRLVPVMVRSCAPTGLLASIVYISLVGLDPEEAQSALLDGIGAQRMKPSTNPPFPGCSDSGQPAPLPGAPAQGSSNTCADEAPYVPRRIRAPTDAERSRYIRGAFTTIKEYFRKGLGLVERQHQDSECQFDETTAFDFTAQIFADGKRVTRCRIWLGNHLSADEIYFAEGLTGYGGNAWNESLHISESDGDLCLHARGMGFTQFDQRFDAKRLTQEQAAAYLWQHFVLPLERR